MGINTVDLQRLADHVRDARFALGLTQAELAAKAGVSYATLQSLERPEPRTRLPNKTPLVERALGWAPGSARAVLNGGNPERLATLAKIRVELMSDDAERIAAAIASSPILSAAEKARLNREITGRSDQ